MTKPSPILMSSVKMRARSPWVAVSITPVIASSTPMIWIGLARTRKMMKLAPRISMGSEPCSIAELTAVVVCSPR
ncbi:hypothetical protein D3C71_1914950 [compost metagenome]